METATKYVLPPDLAEALARKDELAELAGLTPFQFELSIMEQFYKRLEEPHPQFSRGQVQVRS